MMDKIKNIFIFLILGMLVFSSIGTLPDIKADVVNSNILTKLENLGASEIAGWHDEVVLNKHANQYYQKTDDWYGWDVHGMHCDNYWDTSDNDYLYFEFIIDDLPVKEESLIIGVEFKADGWPWNEGPDLEVKNQVTNQWFKRKQSMGKPTSLTWKWYIMTDSNDYITSSGVVQFRILCAAGCHTWVDDVGIKYMSADEAIYEVKKITRDDNGDGHPDGVDVKIDADVGVGAEGIIVDVTCQGVLKDPNGDTVDTDTDTWQIEDWLVEWGILTLSALGEMNGEYLIELTLYDACGNNEDFVYTTIDLIPDPPDPQATITFNIDPTNGGYIIFDGEIFSHGQTVQKTYGDYNIKAKPYPWYGFQEWVTSGGISVSNPYQEETTATVTDDGTLKAIFYYIDLDEAVDNYNLNWNIGGYNDWFGQDKYYYYDNDAAQSGNINNNENTWISTEVTGPVQLKFHWQVSSEKDYDFLKFKIDGVKKAEISGEISWKERIFNIDSGTHVLKWEYSKDESNSEGLDCGWIDKVRIGQLYTIDFYTSPSDGGGISFDGETYEDMDTIFETGGVYNLEAYPENSHKFDHWTSTGDITINDPNSQSTSVTISGDGTIMAWFSYYFVHITDPHVGKNQTVNTRWKYDINQIKSWDPAPKFVVCTGDLVDYGKYNPEAYDKLLLPLDGTNPSPFYISGTNIPVYFCPGNHDARGGAGWNPLWPDFITYRNKIGPEYYFCPETKSYAIFSLNGVWDMLWNFHGDWFIPEGEGLKNLFGNEVDQLPLDIDSLDNVANGIDTSNFVKIIMVHQPFITDLDPNTDGVFWNNRDPFFTGICNDYDVDVVLSGHVHNGNSILDINGGNWGYGDGTRFIITNSIEGWYNGYRNITINPKNSVESVSPGPQERFSDNIGIGAGCQIEAHGYDIDDNHIGINEFGGVDCYIDYASYSPYYKLDEDLNIIDSYTEMSVFRDYDQNYDFVIESLSDDPVNVTISTSLKSGYESQAYYEDLSVADGGVIYVSVDNAIIDYTINIDSDGDGSIDYQSQPSSFTGNLPPEIPNPPDGPTQVTKNEPYTYTAIGIDPDYQYQLWYKFDWGDGEESEWIGPKNPGEPAEATYEWDETGYYSIRVKTKDEHNVESKWSEPLSIEVPVNVAPSAPQVSGPSTIRKNRKYTWFMASDDPNGDNVMFKISILDGMILVDYFESSFIESGDIYEFDYSYFKPTILNMIVKAVDTSYLESDPSFTLIKVVGKK